MGNSYNGFTWKERMDKFKEMNRRIEGHELVEPHGPCRLCGDIGGDGTNVIFEYHDEDYSAPYQWREPAAYMVCRDCHIYRIHQRAAHSDSWKLFLAHVRRGGYAREMRAPEIKRELTGLRSDILRGDTSGLRVLRSKTSTTGQEWYSHLRIEPE